jgi:hypothetical protein
VEKGWGEDEKTTKVQVVPTNLMEIDEYVQFKHN